MFDPRDISHVDTDLTVLDLAEPAAPLPGHADRLVPLLGEGRGVEDDHPVRLAEPFPDLLGEDRERGAMVPVGLADEPLHRLAILVEQISDPLGGLVFQMGEQAGEVFGGASLLAGSQRGAERVDEGLEPVEQAPHRIRRDLGLGHHLLEPLLISHDHGDLPGEGSDDRNRLWINRLQPVNRAIQ